MPEYERCVVKPGELPVWQAPDKSRKVSSLIDEKICGAQAVSGGMFWLAPGQQSEPDIHPHSEEVYYVVRGAGRLVLGDEEYRVSEGMSVYIPAGVHHQSFNDGNKELVYFWVFGPPPKEPSKAEEQGWAQVDD